MPPWTDRSHWGSSSGGQPVEHELSARRTNAVPAAAVVPLLSLGLPGEALTAMMPAVFTVHNVFPGPTLFETRPEFIYGLYGSPFLTNIVAFLFLCFWPLAAGSRKRPG